MDVLALYDAHKNMVYRLALSYLKSVPDAEDAVQQVFLKLLEHRDAVAPGKERSWLAAVTANLCRDMLRAAARRQAEPLPADMPAAPPGDSGLYEAVTALPETERAAVYLYYYEGYDTRETARILGISQTAVTTRLSRARQRLKLRLEDEQYG